MDIFYLQPRRLKVATGYRNFHGRWKSMTSRKLAEMTLAHAEVVKNIRSVMGHGARAVLIIFLQSARMDKYGKL